MKCSPSHIAKGPRAGGIYGIELHIKFTPICVKEKKKII